MGRPYRRRATVTIVESPGAEQWFTIQTATGYFRLPSWVSLEEAWRGINEGWSSMPRHRTVRPGERRFSVPLADYVTFDEWRRNRTASEA